MHEGNKRIRQIKNSILGEAQKQEAEYFAFLTGWQNCMAGLGLTLASVIKIFQLKRNKQTTICFQDLDLVLIIFRFCISVLSYMGLMQTSCRDLHKIKYAYLFSSKYNLDKFERTGIKKIQCCVYNILHHRMSISFNLNKLLSSSCFSSSLVWVVPATQSRWPWC